MRHFSVILAMLVLIAAVSACYSDRPPLIFSPDEVPGASVGEAYEVAINVSDNVTPVWYMAIAEGELPAGLEFIFEVGSDSALIRGTPEMAGEFHFTVSVSCYATSRDGQTGEHAYVIVVE